MSAFQTRTQNHGFISSRLKANLLPPVEQCQSSIFSELRQREETRTKMKAAQRHEQPRGIFGGVLRFASRHISFGDARATA